MERGWRLDGVQGILEAELAAVAARRREPLDVDALLEPILELMLADVADILYGAPAERSDRMMERDEGLTVDTPRSGGRTIPIVSRT